MPLGVVELGGFMVLWREGRLLDVGTHGGGGDGGGSGRRGVGMGKETVKKEEM